MRREELSRLAHARECVPPISRSVSMAKPQVSVLAQTPHVKYDRLIARAKQVSAPTTVVVHPCDETSLRGAVEAAEAGLIVPILVGAAEKIAATAAAHKLDIARYEIA